MPKKAQVTRVSAAEVEEELKQREGRTEETVDKKFIAASHKDLRACIFCKLLLTKAQWKRNSGCPNCPKSTGEVHTTDKYTGLIALIYSRRSWLAKWTENDNYVTGAYAKQILREQREYDLDEDLSEFVDSEEEELV